MKLKKEFIVHDTGSEIVLVPTAGADFSGVVKGNATVGFILEQLKKETSEEEIIRAMSEKYDTSESPGLIERDVKRVLGELRRIGAMDE